MVIVCVVLGSLYMAMGLVLCGVALWGNRQPALTSEPGYRFEILFAETAARVAIGLAVLLLPFGPLWVSIGLLLLGGLGPKVVRRVSETGA